MKSRIKSKFMAGVLSLALAVGMMPTSVMAANDPADITAIKIKGVAVTGVALPADLKNFDAVVDNTINFKLARNLILDETIEIAELTDPTTVEDATAWLLTSTEDAGVLTALDGEGTAITTAIGLYGTISTFANALTETTAIGEGDVLWVTDGDPTDEAELKFARITINQAATGQIEGESTVKSSVLNVILPTNLDFVLDPMGISTDILAGSQIAPAQYTIVNKSGAPVRVGFTIAADDNQTNGGDAVTFVDDPDDVETEGNAKKIYLAAIGASAVTIAPSFADPSLAELAFDPVVPRTIIPFQNKTGSIDFLLGGADLDAEELASEDENNTGVAAFQFYGKMESYHAWADKDIQVSGTYTITAMSTTSYDDTPNVLFAGHQMFIGEPPNDAKLEVTETTTATAYKTAANSPTFTPSSRIYLRDKPAATAITSVMMGTTAYTSPTDYEYDEDIGLLTVKKPTANFAPATLVVTTAAGTYTINYTFKTAPTP